jgi:GntR family transcriptional regulator/MocR family aminotransferase
MSSPVVHPLWGSLAIERDAAVSLQDQVACYFRAAIVDRRLRCGQRLPSSRQLAIDHGISRTTAVEAYERLIAEGYLVSRPGAGLFVADQLLEDLVPERGDAGDTGDVVRMPVSAAPAIHDLRSYQLPLAPGMPAIDLFPWAMWRRHLTALAREAPLCEIGHGDPLGERPLREAIAGYLAAMKAIPCDPDQIVVINGTTQIFEVAMQLLRVAGAQILLEDPGYPFLYDTAERTGLVPVPVPVDLDGMDIRRGMAKAPDASIALVSPSHHVPLGVCLSLERRRALVEWADRTGGWIIENEFDADYRYSSRALPTCFSLSRSGRVVLIGSVSKPFAPGLRVGYLALPQALVPRAAEHGLPQAPVITQLALARMSESGQLAAHLRHLRVVHAGRRARLIAALHDLGRGLLDIQEAPEAGLRICARLPEGFDDVAVVHACLAAGVKLEALSNCHRGSARRPGLLMGFGSTPEERIVPAVATIVDVLRRHSPRRVANWT